MTAHSPLPLGPFGSTGFFLSPLGVGTVKWGRTEGLKHGAFTLPDDRTCEALLDLALERGVNFLDTAPAYGIAEERLGRLVNGGERRGKFHLFTKAGERFENGKSTWDFSAESIRRSVENSLRALRADALDGVLIHSTRDDLRVLRETPALETLLDLKARGLVKTAGFSVMSLEGGLAAAALCDLLMVAWNPGFREHEPVVAEAARLGKGVLLKKVLDSGFPKPELTPPGVSPAAHAIRSALALPGRPAVVAGTITRAHLEENIRASADAADVS